MSDDGAVRAIAAVRRIHRPMQLASRDWLHCWTCSNLSHDDDGYEPWPCETMRVIFAETGEES